MALSIDEVTQIAKDAAIDASPALRLHGVTLGGGEGSEYVEVLVSIENCGSEPCRIQVGAFRNVAKPHLHQEITRKLREHLHDRQIVASSPLARPS